MEDPRFVKADIEFTVDEHVLAFPERYITISGVTGLPWKPLSPSKHFGLRVAATLTLSDEKLETEALIMREHSFQGTTMGLRFLFSAETREALAETFHLRGATRPGFVRQFPRIPSVDEIQTFPLRAIATLPPQGAPSSDRRLALDVRNLSIAGMLVSTEEPAAVILRPGDRLMLSLEPRGGFSREVRVYGYVCRVTDEVDPVQGTPIQFLAIRFLNTSLEGRREFLELLQDIVRRIELETAPTAAS